MKKEIKRLQTEIRLFKRKSILLNREQKVKYFDKINAIITGLLTLVSTGLAVLTYNQQQDIKGMSDLLRKQDKLIDKQDKLFNVLSKLTIQNYDMINELKTSQEIMSKQNQSIDNQTIVSKYLSKPIMNLSGLIYLKKKVSDTIDTQYTLSVGFKNNGHRSAANVEAVGVWADITNGKVISTPKLIYRFPNEFQPNEENHLDVTISLDKNQLASFYNLYFIFVVHYKDVLTNNNERHIVIGKQFKVDQDKISYSYVTGVDRQLLERLIVLEKM